MVLRSAIITACSLALLAGAGEAKAATTTATMNNTATVASYCTVTTGSLAFGTYTGAANVTTSATVSATCTNTTAYTIALDKGANGTSETARLLKASGSAATLSYGIFSDSGYTTNWGTTAGAQSGTGNGSAQNFTAYGKISSGQFVTPDSYTDTVTVTLTY